MEFSKSRFEQMNYESRKDSLVVPYKGLTEELIESGQMSKIWVSS